MTETIDLSMATREPVVLDLGAETEVPFRRVRAYVTVEGWVATENGTLVVTFKKAGVL